MKQNTASFHDTDGEDNDVANLQKDLALQRLLKESHLLDGQSLLSLAGQARHKAHDLRVQSLGSKHSIYSQQKMPFAQRRGISTKKAEQEQVRRHEAQENGLVLEKLAQRKARSKSKRERGIGAPAVGKFRGGLLQLSEKDVARIQGPRKSPKRK